MSFFDCRTFQNIFKMPKGAVSFRKENLEVPVASLGDNPVRRELRKGPGHGNITEKTRRR